MAETFLNSICKVEDKIIFTLNFSKELGSGPIINTGCINNFYTTKTFILDKYKAYNITYVFKSPHHNAKLVKFTGRIIQVGYTCNTSNFVDPKINRTMAPSPSYDGTLLPGNHAALLRPATFTIDASTEFANDVRVINIDDIRDFEVADNGIDFSKYEIGDTINIIMDDGHVFPKCVIQDYYGGFDFDSVIVSQNIEPVQQGWYPEERWHFLKKQDIKTVEMVKKVTDYPFGLGDTVEITVREDLDENDEYDAYPGVIMDIITKYNDKHYTEANVLGVLLKYTGGTGDKPKECIRLFRRDEIIRIIPFTFPWEDPDIVTVADEAYSGMDDPDNPDHYNDNDFTPYHPDQSGVDNPPDDSVDDDI